MALDSWRPELVGAIEQIELAAGLDAHALEDDRAERAAAAAQRHGQQRGRASPSDGETISARVRAHRQRPPAPSASSVLTRMPRATPAGIGRGLQHEMTRAPIVDPDRRAVGAEQPVGAVTEDVEAGGQVQRAPTGSRRTRRAARGGRAAARRSGAGGTARARSRTRRPLRRVAVHDCDVGGGASKPIASRPTRSLAAHERQEQRRRRVRAAPARSGICRPRRRRASARARANASATSAASVGPGIHGSVRQLVEAEARRGLQRAVARIVLEQQRADAAGDVERVLMELRQQVGRCACRAPAATPAAAAPCRRSPGRRAGGRPRQSSGSRFSGHLDLAARAASPRFYCESVRMCANSATRSRDRHVLP